jgi:hypothetical protein
MKVLVFIISLNLWFSHHLFSQNDRSNLIYIDKEGVVRYSKDNKEAAFFGVNYTVPFAYGYRSHKALGVDLEKAIQQDVYHMSRLGLDAFRVHMWDVELSDSLGNVLDNEHLKLFDFLIAELKKKNIRILITPIAFWGNGYPEKDVKTNGFSYVYGKGNAVINERAIKAQENYIKQILQHKNEYTGLTYIADPDIIAMEINNEPHHSGPKEKTTEYINRLYASARNAGWTKPIFYNISESPVYADAVVKSKADGYSFQWYPTGLVAGHEQKGNYLPNVDRYTIPFGDTIAAFNNKPRMVYEFDAADVLQSNMYPAIARSFRTAGFWWATQFAYDPLATAYGNTEYQTHFLNLLYTPSKAVSLMIASKAFHQLPGGKSYGSFPVDTSFDAFRVSYKNQLSEMNSAEEFYYSNTTNTKPKDLLTLKHIAGVGSSPLVQYNGSGAYFLDKISNGAWRLEVMPDAIVIRDPFAKASPKKEVVRLESNTQTMEISLPDLGNGFTYFNHNEPAMMKQGNKLKIKPGVYYLLNKTNNKLLGTKAIIDTISIPSFNDPFISHQPFESVTANKPFSIHIKTVGIDTTSHINIEFRNSSNKWKTVKMMPVGTNDWTAEVPADIITPGIINYRFIVEKANKDFYTFPGGFKGDPYGWDNTNNESYETVVLPQRAPLVLFNPMADRGLINLYNNDWRRNTVEYITTSRGSLVQKMTITSTAAADTMGWQFYFADKIAGRATELPNYSYLVIRGKALHADTRVSLNLITADGDAFSSIALLDTSMKIIKLPLKNLVKGSNVLLPRPYPRFMPLHSKSSSAKAFDITEAERLEVLFSSAGKERKPTAIEIESIYLSK